jgi:hypothetical protein
MDVASLAIILGTPILSKMNISFDFVGNILVRFLLLAFLIYQIRQGPLPGLFALLAVATLILERHHQILTSFRNQLPIIPKSQNGHPIQATPLTPTSESVHYETPHMESEGEKIEDNREYEKATDLEDNNPRLEGPPSNSEAASFFKVRPLLN